MASSTAKACQNPIIIGVQESGKRSEGKIRRLGPDGARLLDDEIDLTMDKKPRTIKNSKELRISKTVGQPQFDRNRWSAIQSQIHDRGQSQRGIRRAADPSRYPLSCREVDLTDGCGSVMYGRTNHERAVYTCGRYMRTGECNSNQVDAEAALRLTLKTIRQIVILGGREDLRSIFFAMAARHSRIDPTTTEFGRAKARHRQLQAEFEVIESRLAREVDEDLYAGLRRQYRAAKTALDLAKREVDRLEANHSNFRDHSPNKLVKAAMEFVDEVRRITSDAEARENVNPMLQRLGIRLGLWFRSATKGKTRPVRQLAAGRMFFGDAPLPTVAKDPCYGIRLLQSSQIAVSNPQPADAEHTLRQEEASVQSEKDASADLSEFGQNQQLEIAASQTGAVATDVTERDFSSSFPTNDRLEGISITKGNRGEKI